MKKNYIVSILTLFIMSISCISFAQPVTDIPPKEKCKVCGMLVAKYKPWISQLQNSDGSTSMFDGVKDMMAYYFEPGKYGETGSMNEVYVKDYYSQKWIDGKKAFYVVGSDVHGPMGHEFIPFNSMAAADNFKKDHHGKTIVPFDDITLEMVNTLRSAMKGNQKMKHGK